MALGNILGLLFPLGVALTIGKFTLYNRLIAGKISNICFVDVLLLLFRGTCNWAVLPRSHQWITSWPQRERHLLIRLPSASRLRHTTDSEQLIRRRRKVLHLFGRYSSLSKHQDAAMYSQVSQEMRRSLAALRTILPNLPNSCRSIIFCCQLNQSWLKIKAICVSSGSGLLRSLSSMLF